MNIRLVLTLILPLGAALAQTAPPKDHTLGYDDTPVLPNQKWRVHDVTRGRPKMVTPGAQPGQAPSDAIVLFDGKDLSQWIETARGGQTSAPHWKVENGYFEVVPRTGSLNTKESFGDVQLHIEWATPAEIKGKSQDRGNSGVIFMGKYEVQVLDSWGNDTYADGQAGSLYGQWPPLVNASRKPGEWQVYDIVFEAPHFEGDRVVKPAFVTVFHNGVLLHNRQELIGDTPHAHVGVYKAHAAELPLQLQNHGTPVRYRNIWIRRLKGYDSN